MDGTSDFNFNDFMVGETAPSEMRQLAQKIANVDSLVSEIRVLENKNSMLQNNLRELQNSAKDIQNLYEVESNKARSLFLENQKLKHDLNVALGKVEDLEKKKTSDDLLNEQISISVNQLKNLEQEHAMLKMKYDRLCARFFKQAIILKSHGLPFESSKKFLDGMKRYLHMNNILVGNIELKTPKKTELTCTLLKNSSSIMREKDTLNKQYVSRGTQYICSTTTRSTSTSAFITHHTTGTNFPEVVPISIEDILRTTIIQVPDIIEPIRDLSASVHKKSVGTCTTIRNIRKKVGYITKEDDNNMSQQTQTCFDMMDPNAVKAETPSPSGSLTNLNCNISLKDENICQSESKVASLLEMWDVLGKLIFSLIEDKPLDKINQTQFNASVINKLKENMISADEKPYIYTPNYDFGLNEFLRLQKEQENFQTKEGFTESLKSDSEDEDTSSDDSSLSDEIPENKRIVFKNSTNCNINVLDSVENYEKSENLRKRNFADNMDTETELKKKKIDKIPNDPPDLFKRPMDVQEKTVTSAKNLNTTQATSTDMLSPYSRKIISVDINNEYVDYKKCKVRCSESKDSIQNKSKDIRANNLSENRIANVPKIIANKCTVRQINHIDTESCSTLSFDDNVSDMDLDRLCKKIIKVCTSIPVPIEPITDLPYEMKVINNEHSSNVGTEEQLSNKCTADVVDIEDSHTDNQKSEKALENQKLESNKKECLDNCKLLDIKKITLESFESDKISKDEIIQHVKNIEDTIPIQLNKCELSENSKESRIILPINNEQSIEDEICIRYTNEDDLDHSPKSPEPTDIIQENPIIIPTCLNIPEIEKRRILKSNTYIGKFICNYDEQKYKILSKKKSKITCIIDDFNINKQFKKLLEEYILESENSTNKLEIITGELNKNANIKSICSTIIYFLENINSKVTNVKVVANKIIKAIKSSEINYRSIRIKFIAFLEQRIFNLRSEIITIPKLLNLINVYMILGNISNSSNLSSARLLIYKCLYYYKHKAIPMIYLILKECPNILPNIKNYNIDDADILLKTLICVLNRMDHGNDSNLCKMLKYNYGYKRFEPSREKLLDDLVESIQNGNFENIPHSFALLCKRCEHDWSLKDVIDSKLLPLLEKYTQNICDCEENDSRVAVLLETISLVLKPFPLTYNIGKHQEQFYNILFATQRQQIQEAVIKALLRTSRFGYTDCFNRICRWQPSYKVNRTLNDMLITFIHRKRKSFWKKFRSQI